MSQEIFKILYNVNQVLKKNFDSYYYIAEKNLFYAVNTVTVKIIELKSVNNLFTENFYVADSKNLFTELKNVKTKDSITFNENKNEIEIIINNEVKNNLLTKDSKSKRINSIFNETLLTANNIKELNLNESTFYNDKLLIEEINSEKFKEIIKVNREITNHLIYFLELDFDNKSISLHKRKTDINLDNTFLIFESKYIVSIPEITKKVNQDENLSFYLCTNNIIRIVYSNFDFKISCHFITLT